MKIYKRGKLVALVDDESLGIVKSSSRTFASLWRKLLSEGVTTRGPGTRVKGHLTNGLYMLKPSRDGLETYLEKLGYDIKR